MKLLTLGFLLAKLCIARLVAVISAIFLPVHNKPVFFLPFQSNWQRLAAWGNRPSYLDALQGRMSEEAVDSTASTYMALTVLPLLVIRQSLLVTCQGIWVICFDSFDRPTSACDAQQTVLWATAAFQFHRRSPVGWKFPSYTPNSPLLVQTGEPCMSDRRKIPLSWGVPCFLKMLGVSNLSESGTQHPVGFR